MHANLNHNVANMCYPGNMLLAAVASRLSVGTSILLACDVNSIYSCLLLQLNSIDFFSDLIKHQFLHVLSYTIS